MKIIYITIGFISLGLGFVGVFLPVLPTVPFLLLSSFCFTKGSKKFHCWFTKTGIYKNHIESFEKEKSMTMATKVKLLLFSSTMIAIPIFTIKNTHVRIFLVLLVIFKYYFFIFRIKTIKNE